MEMMLLIRQPNFVIEEWKFFEEAAPQISMQYMIYR